MKMSSGDHRQAGSLDIDFYRTSVHCMFVHLLMLVRCKTHKLPSIGSDIEASPSVYNSDNPLCGMAVGTHGCILLGVAWSKAPHKLDILCQPYGYPQHY